ncbi:MAG: NAD-binding protein [Arcobacteraceae bacterium]|nr:NAD-binding protein [Arcobacteraceae bacterium]
MKEIIVFGCGKLGYEISLQLQKTNSSFVIITTDMIEFKRAKSQNLNVVLEESIDDDILDKYGLGRFVRTIFCLMEDDVQNLFITISARFMDEGLRIISKADSLDDAQKFISAGASKILDPYELSANKIFDYLKKPNIVQTIENTIFSDEPIQMAEVFIEEHSPFQNRFINDIDFKEEFDLIFLGVKESTLSDSFIFSTSGTNHRLSVGNILVVIGHSQDIQKMKL